MVAKVARVSHLRHSETLRRETAIQKRYENRLFCSPKIYLCYDFTRSKHPPNAKGAGTRRENATEYCKCLHLLHVLLRYLLSRLSFLSEIILFSFSSVPFFVRSLFTASLGE